MERIRNLDKYQKGILVLLLVMYAVFAAVYFVVISRVGYLYHDTVLVPGEENGNTVYSGKIDGKQAVFTVTADQAVTFRHGEKLYGPYTVKEDPTAIPEEDDFAAYMTGYEIRDGEEIFFRGGGFKNGGDDGYWMLYNEDGSFASISITAVASDGAIVTDGKGNIIDPMEPSAGTILQMVEGPKLTNKGHWGFYLIAGMFSVVIVISILFADEVFRWGLRYQIRNPELAEPSDWEIASRYIGWTALTVAVLVVYIMGLQV